MGIRTRSFAFRLGVFTVTIAHGSDETLKPDSLALSIDSYLAPLVKEKKFSGVVLVAKHGKPIVRKAYGFADWSTKTPNMPETRFMIFSVTKQFTTAAILRLQDQGKLSVEDPASKHVADWPAEWKAVTIHHLLSHTSGIEVDTLYFWLCKHHPRFWEDPKQSPPPYDPKALVAEPGKTFRYSNAGFNVLSLIVERATGKPFANALRELVFAPLAMNETDSERFSPTRPRAKGHQWSASGIEFAEQNTNGIVGAGDVASTIDDMMKWNRSLDGDEFLSARAREAMFKTHVQGSKWGYGYGWQLRKGEDGTPLQIFGGSGTGFICNVVRRPNNRLYAAVLCNVSADGDYPYALEVVKLAEKDANGSPR